ncbi:protein tramtrack, alpha isoform isoform X1 [Drosophila willistoni]|nr:protein tramtrack, alpha isoform isoform X1 [Drosophila willistoni]XP_046869466.1 protein tramtrack, alpha isoform isoform X1 [Drosophila willistoni]
MKMASQRFCLRWNNHQTNLLSVFDQLLHAETFTDVTLAVEGQYLKAHKMVLSACSPYFNALFMNHPENHPIVILKDVPYSDMKSLLDFMYRGEVSVDQERLTAFLRVAESLRIKGLTEVNDDKPSPAESAPAPPQLQRIQPYLVPQQRNRSQGNLLANNTSALTTNNPTMGTHQQQQQTSLLSSALMPKRKRGRPRKLSGSSNGTGNDFDDFEREASGAMMHESSDMGNGKLGNDSNDDGSDDNQLESGNNDDLNESRDSSVPSKRSKNAKDHRANQQQQQEDNSTSATPELSQRLFGSTTTTTISAEPVTTVNSEMHENAGVHLPTILGLKIRAIKTTPTQQLALQQTSPTPQQSSNSLLKQQLRSGAKDPEPITISSNSSTPTPTTMLITNTTPGNVVTPATLTLEEEIVIETKPSQEETAALNSLANAAEHQAALNDANNGGNNNNNNNTGNGQLHHQLLMQMAANFQHQQQAQSPTGGEQFLDEELELLDKCDEPTTDHEMPTLTDENAGLPGYQTEQPQTTNTSVDATIVDVVATPKAKSTGSSKRPIQRRRVRRKAQSTLDDQAEHLTEMSVRGLDLFRYASVVEGVYRCTECAKENMQKTFKNKYSFQRHAFLYHEGKHRKVFPCPVCSKEFSRPDKMKNHLKMTHENFTPPKDLGFNPLKYLITAAAAGDMQASLHYQQQQQQQQQQEQYHLQMEQQQQHQQHQEHQEHQQLSDYQDNTLLLPDVKQEQHDEQEDEHEPAAAAAAMLSLSDDVIIKNEIQISPSPSPSPPSLCAVTEGKSLPLATAAQTAT